MSERELPILYNRKEECCGCTACYAICPQKAILMIEDDEGFEYPEVDKHRCVRCYMCLKVCQIKNNPTDPQNLGHVESERIEKR